MCLLVKHLKPNSETFLGFTPNQSSLNFHAMIYSALLAQALKTEFLGKTLYFFHPFVNFNFSMPITSSISSPFTPSFPVDPTSSLLYILRIFQIKLPRDPFALATTLLNNVSGVPFPRLNDKVFDLISKPSSSHDPI